MKKGIKLIALITLACAVLSCGQGIPSGGNKEDEAVFTGNGYAYRYDKNTDKEYKEHDWMRNLRLVLKKDGTYTMTGEVCYIDTGWIDIEGGKEPVPYTFSEDTVDILDRCKYSYDGTTLILKRESIIAGENQGGEVYILSSKTRASFIPLRTPALSTPAL